MYPKIFGILNTYGLMIGIGIIACFWVTDKYCKKKNIDSKFVDFVEWLGIIAIIFGLMSSAIFQSFYNYLENPAGGFDNGVESIIGLILIIFFILLIVLFQIIAKKLKLDADKKDRIDRILIVCVAISSIAPTIVSALIAYFNGASSIDFGSGVTFIGGLIGGVVSFLVVYFWKRNLFQNKLMDILSIVPCCITIAHGFGRIGCFFAGCCYGIQSNTFLDVNFPIWNMNWEIVGYSAHLPTQLYEAIFLFILFGIMSYLVMKKNFQYNMPVYLVAYGIWRFALEFIRGDDRGSFIPNISPSQFWSILMVIIGIVLFIYQYKYFKKKNINNDSNV